jgi:hypothetical protein
MKRLVLASIFFVVFLGLLKVEAMALGPEDVQKITVHELKEKLDKGEKVIILDMRVGASDVRMPLQSVDMRARELPMGYDIVIY